MEYISINGEHKIVDLAPTKRDLYIMENSDVKEITKIPSRIIFLKITENPNLTAISARFSRNLKTLVITKNKLLTNMPRFYDYMESITIYNNDSLHIEDQLAEYRHRSSVTAIITEEDDLFEDNDEVELLYIVNQNLPVRPIDSGIKILDKNWKFEKNVRQYRHSPPFLYNDNPFLIHYKEYQGYSYPVITLPKGTVLYTYSENDSYSENDCYKKLYGIDGKSELDLDDDLKFFYPVPYAAEYGVYKNYNTCNIVYTNADIQILCLLSPAPQTIENLKISSENPVINKDGMNYYENNLTGICSKEYYVNLCLRKQMMLDMKLDGYMCIPEEDSISNSAKWAGFMLQEELTAEIADIIRKFVVNSCMSSQQPTTSNNNDIFNDKLRLQLPEKLEKRMFGVPEIALVPIKTSMIYRLNNKHMIERLFGDSTITAKEHVVSKEYYSRYFNYSVINICRLPEIKPFLDSISADIVNSKQTTLLSLYRPAMDTDSELYKETITMNSTQLNEDVNYLKSYHGEHQSFSALETVNYHFMAHFSGGGNSTNKYYTKRRFRRNTKKKRRGGDSSVVRKAKSLTLANHMMTKNAIISTTTKDDLSSTGERVFQQSSSGIPIMFFR